MRITRRQGKTFRLMDRVRGSAGQARGKVQTAVGGLKDSPAGQVIPSRGERLEESVPLTGFEISAVRGDEN